MWGNEDVDMDMYSFKMLEEVGCGGMRTLTCICIVSKL